MASNAPMTHLRRSAILLLALDDESAAMVLRQLPAREVQEVSRRQVRDLLFLAIEAANLQ